MLQNQESLGPRLSSTTDQLCDLSHVSELLPASSGCGEDGIR